MPNFIQSISTDEVILLYDQNADRIFQFFFYKTHDEQIAQDLTSETFLQFIEQIKRNKQIDNLKAYLYGIAKIIFTKFLQKKYNEPVTVIDGLDFDLYITHVIEKSTLSVPLETRILPYLQQLPEKQKIVLRMRLIEKHSLSEIAQKLNKNMNYVKTTQKRGIANLKKLIACTP